MPGLSSQSHQQSKPHRLKDETGENKIESILQEEIIQDFANEQELMRKHFAGKLVFLSDVYFAQEYPNAEPGR